MDVTDDDPTSSSPPPSSAAAPPWRLDPRIERRLSAGRESSSSQGVVSFNEEHEHYARGSTTEVVLSSNLPGLSAEKIRARSAAAPNQEPRRQESFSSLSLPGGHVGSEPHSRRQTPKDGGWVRGIDIGRLFAGLRGPDETLTPLQTPEGKGSRGRRTPGSGAEASAREPFLDDDDDDDDSVQSFRDTVAPGSKHQDHHHHHSEAYDAHLKSRSGSWLSRLWNKHFDQANYYNETFRARDFESDYLALVPLSDPRLSHRWPLWVFVLLSALLCGTMFCAVFFFVQRQVEVNQGEIFTRTSSIHVNPIKPGDYHGNYSLDLKIDIPVHNQNYFPATISGGIGIYLYNYKGGEVELDHAQVPSRSTRVFSITANASNFDSMVTSTIIGRCTVLQPHLLQFVLKGEFSTEVLFYGAQTTRINTYAIVDCKIKEEWPWG